MSGRWPDPMTHWIDFTRWYAAPMTAKGDRFDSLQILTAAQKRDLLAHIHAMQGTVIFRVNFLLGLSSDLSRTL